jgi:hypothetical protein
MLMGMCARLIAIGPFSKDLTGIINYPDKNCLEAHEGVFFAHELYGIIEGSSTSREFASCFGINDPWDFHQHKINNKNININELQIFSTTRNYSKDFFIFKKLFDNGFEFHFRPEG